MQNLVLFPCPVQFLFIDSGDVPETGGRPFKIKESLRTVTPQGHLTTTTKTTFKQNGEFIIIFMKLRFILSPRHYLVVL